jgi:hypothetical protein
LFIYVIFLHLWKSFFWPDWVLSIIYITARFLIAWFYSNIYFHGVKDYLRRFYTNSVNDFSNLDPLEYFFISFLYGNDYNFFKAKKVKPTRVWSIWDKKLRWIKIIWRFLLNLFTISFRVCWRVLVSKLLSKVINCYFWVALILSRSFDT